MGILSVNYGIDLRKLSFLQKQSVHHDHMVSYRSWEVWKVCEFQVEIFQALKSLQNYQRCEKLCKILESCEADLGNIAFHYTG